MTTEQMKVLRKIIAAVETGGQVYGKGNYGDFTEAYTNSGAEHSITIGCYQFYAGEAKKLLLRIKEAGGEGFTEELNRHLDYSWTALQISKNSSIAKTIVNVITSDIGKRCQDELVDEQLSLYCNEAVELGVTDARGQAMCANFRHQGGYGALKRIIAKTSRPYTLENLYQATLSDTGNQVGTYRTRQKKVYKWLKKYMSKEGEKAVTKTVEQVRKSALDWMLNLARDDSHGYSQDDRWGPDYDCSSALITAFKQAGVPLTCTYTGNMYDDMCDNGFQDVTNQVNLATGAGLQPSDVLLNVAHHTAMYAGSGQEVEASINEKGGAHGGISGDQTGKEILIRPYRNYPWDCVLRYQGNTVVTLTPVTTVNLPEITKGSIGAPVSVLQGVLTMMGYQGKNGLPLDVDGDFGDNTTYALVEYQKAAKLTADGICGVKTWTKLKKGLKP